MLAWRGYLIVRNHRDRFARYLAFGLTTAIVAQAFLNLAVVSSLVPATGLPLPFYSSGGSALLTTFAMCGLLVGLSRRPNETADERTAGAAGSAERRAARRSAGRRALRPPIRRLRSRCARGCGADCNW